MRSTTLLAHLWRVSILAVALLALPQLASAQLPLETKSLRIQAQTGTNAVTLTTPDAVTPYSITLPGALAPGNGPGAFMYTNNATGGLIWTNFPTGAGFSLRWDGTNIVWFDPNGADNPNWSLNGNAITAAGRLGTTTVGGSINIVTGLTGLTRMTVEANGNINIATDAANGGDVTIGNDNAVNVNGATIGITGVTTVTGATTVVGVTNINATGGANTTVGTSASGTVTVQGATLTTSGALGHTGTSSFTGNVTLGTASALIMETDPGASGEVLVSKGANTTPAWESITEAVGIRKAGKVAVTGDLQTITVTGVTGLTTDDAIIVTIEGANGVVASVTNRNTPTAGTFVVNFSGAYTGNLNYMVIRNQ